jgi:ribonuclease BN (tRNA processing enzyme)
MTNEKTYTIDVLTDGSELTGDGSLFLSVYKSKPYYSDVLLQDPDGVTPPLARYCITGLGDLTSRLAFDQRFKLQYTRAVFATSRRGLEGLSPLLLNLQHAGAERVTVVSTHDKVQEMVELLHGKASHPIVNICNVPESKAQEGESAQSPYCWWMVYSDEHLIVHAKRNHSSAAVVYLYTLLQHTERNASILVVSDTSADWNLEHILQQLPVVRDDTEVARVCWGVVLQQDSIMTTSRPLDLPFNNMMWLVTQPCKGRVDPGLLVRAQQQSTAWHSTNPRNFPWNDCSNNCEENNHPSNASPTRSTSPTSSSPCRLQTGWSVLLTETVSFVDRMEKHKQNDESSSPERSLWPTRWDFSLKTTMIQDDNEIELSDDNNENDETISHKPLTTDATAELLVLGTGCAAPSPYRGSSGHCIFMDECTFVFEVGDGFLTQWNRYTTTRSLLSIKAIWISHAHWDHYGGLVALLSKLREMRQQQTSQSGHSQSTEPESRKRQRIETSFDEEPPWVLASGKILKYLDLFLEKPKHFFRPVNISRDPKLASEVVCRRLTTGKGLVSPIEFFETIPVDHSCFDSFGFILGLRRGKQVAPFVFCFSGDTRPCDRFARACKQIAQQTSHGIVDMLLHEATFEESESEMSVAKKHSTVSEALYIGKSIRARKIYLTHFSQRYDAPPNYSSGQLVDWTPTFDGLQIPLF